MAEKTAYNKKELLEFKTLILEKIERAQEDLEILRAATSNDSDNGTEDTSPTFKAFEEGSTTLSKEEISKLSKLKDKEINEAKQVLAFEVTKMVRGEEGANEANEMANNLFKSNITDIRVNNFTLNSKEILDNSFTIIDAIEKLSLVKILLLLPTHLR